ncbi:MAG TPA: hypothetical protein VF600_01190 [Abditibacteriaceae bacterium]
MFWVLFAAAQVWLTLYALRGESIAERADVGATLLAADAVLLAFWQWRGQRREVAAEAYFARLDIPNQRRLAYYEQVIAFGDAAGKQASIKALEQFYIFYMYAEIDNLEYALTKFADGDMRLNSAQRAVNTFISRCKQSSDFAGLARLVVTESGYSTPLQKLVEELLCPDDVSVNQASSSQEDYHPMQYDELEVLRMMTGQSGAHK